MVFSAEAVPWALPNFNRQDLAGALRGSRRGGLWTAGAFRDGEGAFASCEVLESCWNDKALLVHLLSFCEVFVLNHLCIINIISGTAGGAEVSKEKNI